MVCMVAMDQPSNRQENVCRGKASSSSNEEQGDDQKKNFSQRKNSSDQEERREDQKQKLCQEKASESASPTEQEQDQTAAEISKHGTDQVLKEEEEEILISEKQNQAKKEKGVQISPSSSKEKGIEISSSSSISSSGSPANSDPIRPEICSDQNAAKLTGEPSTPQGIEHKTPAPLFPPKAPRKRMKRQRRKAFKFFNVPPDFFTQLKD